MSAKDKAWDLLFEKLNISDELEKNGCCSITAEQIKDLTSEAAHIRQQEPRILTKYDTREQRAKKLRNHNCTILATSNGTYSIFSGDGYHDVEGVPGVANYTSEHLLSLETLPHICATESQVIDTACASGLLADFLEDDTFSMTIRGRSRSSEFNFKFDEHEVNVDGVQVEVDAGYEGQRIYLIEAKMGARDNFITRQLYYPYRMWDAKGVKKEIVPVFLSYSDGTFNIYEYAFREHEQYNSIELVKSGAFTLEDRGVKAVIEGLLVYNTPQLLQGVESEKDEPEVPFPQADDVRKVVDAVFAVASGYATKPEIANYYDFDQRQSDYYGNAARYIGFLEFEEGRFALTDEGREFVGSNKDERRLLLLRAIMKSPTLNHCVKEMLMTGVMPRALRLAEIIRSHRGEINDTTARRRAHTVHNWLEWVRANIDL